ncbi:uncharacterized protein MEPE_02286 [Melanopsichium pennsylvanicum]|uniref:Uncharacterized protein n=2 Tax=Melanopsichium pennsylvanicum TaxID=63383 RepID=A0AAJ5C4J4_9BASI|nr:putative protein [Melanopsichium pennsylvanicum 4]SNX83579.1 uncharacterized protein MEPE_02286 [Melanopsichium pennsylvanicum]
MGSCMSKNTTVAEEVNPAPHPEARQLWLVSTFVDPKDIPSDLVGIDSDGLKAAMRNRGLETDHWALKVDSPYNVQAESSIFDITLEGGKLVSQIHPTSSPYWKSITRRLSIGWTIWKDQEIFHASKLLIQARPNYDGKNNNSQLLARLLARHIQLVPVVKEVGTTTTTSETIAGHATSPVGSIIKRDSASQEAATTSANNRSQMTLVSGAPSQRSQSIESDANHHEMSSNHADSHVAASVRHSRRISTARPPLIHLSTAPTRVESQVASFVRPAFQHSAQTESPSPTGSMRLSLPPQPRQQSLLNPGHRTHRQTASEIKMDGRARARSDATVSHVTMSAHRRMTMEGKHVSTRRRSEAPSEWLEELPNKSEAKTNSIRSRSAQPRNTSHRDSMMSVGGGGGSVIALPSMASWGPSMGFPVSPSMCMPGMPGMPGTPGTPGMQMGGFSTPPPMGMWSAPSANTMLSRPYHGLQVPVPPYLNTQQMPTMPQWGMPMLAPPSPGFHSHASSAVPTPPESPHLLPIVGKGGVSEMHFHDDQHQPQTGQMRA